MRKDSLNLLAIAVALAVLAGGRALAPDCFANGDELLGGQAGSGARTIGPAGPLSLNGSPGRYIGSAHPPTVWPGTSKSRGRLPATAGGNRASDWFGSTWSSVRNGWDTFTDWLTPETPVRAAKDPVSLATKPNPSPDLYVAVARLEEQAGKVSEAEQNYQKALKLDAQHLGALVGYARLKDRQGQMEEATQLYQQAAKSHPNNASLFNDFGLCYARRGMFNDSIAALERAIQLQPTNPRYRNNIAMVLVETRNVNAAVSHLRAVQPEAIAYYNVGYLLQKKGDTKAARELFVKALQKNASLAAARIWLEKLASESPLGVAPSPEIAAGSQPSIHSSAPQGPPRSQFGNGPHLKMTPLPSQPSRVAGRPPQGRQLPTATGNRMTPSFRADGLPGGSRPGGPAPMPPSRPTGELIRAPSQPPRAGAGPAGLPVVHPLPPVDEAPGPR